jgi:hypothetical protein
MRAKKNPAAWLLALAAAVCPQQSLAQANGLSAALALRTLDTAGSPQTFALHRVAQPRTNQDQARWLTTARIHQDAQGLHVLVKASDATPERIQAPLGPHDATLGGDSITLSVDAKGNGQATYEFRVNAAGSTADNIAHGLDGSVKPWSGPWSGRALLTAFGWEVSYLVPWATLGLDARHLKPQRIAVNVVRHVGRGDMPVLSMAPSDESRRCHACGHQPLALMPGAQPPAAVLGAPPLASLPAGVGGTSRPTSAGSSVTAAAPSNRASANLLSTAAPRSGATTSTVAANTELNVSRGHAWQVAAEASRTARASISEGSRGNVLRAQQTIAQDDWTHQLSLNAKREGVAALSSAQPAGSQIEATHRLARDVKRDGPDTLVSGYGAALASQGRWKRGTQDTARGVDLTGQLHLQRHHSLALGVGTGTIDGRPATLRARRTSLSGKSQPLERLNIQASVRTGTAPSAEPSLTQRSHGLRSDTNYQINPYVAVGALSLVERTEQRPGDSSKDAALQASTTIGFNAHHQLRLAASTHQRHQSQTSASTSFPRSEKSTRGQWNYTYRPSHLATVVFGQRHATSLGGINDAALQPTVERNNDKVWFTQVVVTY